MSLINRPARRREHQWEFLDVAARRLGRHVGHLRRLTAELERRGLARKVKGGGLKARWQVRADLKLPALNPELAPATRHRAITLTVGDTSIQISAASTVTLRITPAARGGGKRSRGPSEGSPIDIR